MSVSAMNTPAIGDEHSAAARLALHATRRAADGTLETNEHWKRDLNPLPGGLPNRRLYGSAHREDERKRASRQQSWSVD